MFILYIYNEDGLYSPAIYIESSLENLARAIARGANVLRIQITDSMDYEILSTIGNYIDTCNEELLEKLLPILIPFQIGEKDPFEGVIEYKYDEEGSRLSKIQFEHWIRNSFKYNLGCC